MGVRKLRKTIQVQCAERSASHGFEQHLQECRPLECSLIWGALTWPDDFETAGTPWSIDSNGFVTFVSDDFVYDEVVTADLLAEERLPHE